MNAAAASDPAMAQLHHHQGWRGMMESEGGMMQKKMSKMKKTKKKPLPQQPGTWSAIETLHLIEAYEEKWYSLKRGQLRMSHWEEVAHSVACRMAAHPHPEDATPQPKSSVQCRHKLEKLRRRYRAERPLVLLKGPPNASRWPFFQRMDLMESGPHAASPPPPPLPPAIPVAKAGGINLPARNSSRNSDKAIGLSFGGIRYDHDRGDPNQSTMSLEEEEEEPEEEEPEEEEEEEDSDQPPPAKPLPNSRSNSNSKRSRPSLAHLPPRHIVNDDYPHYHHHNDGYGYGYGYGYGHMPSSNFNPKKQYVDTPISSSQKHEYARNHPRYFLKKLGPSSAELISVLRYLGEGFLKMEQMKIQLQRETELFRADMELRHTEMVLEAQKQISWEFSAALGSRNKKAKKIHSTLQDD